MKKTKSYTVEQWNKKQQKDQRRRRKAVRNAKRSWS